MLESYDSTVLLMSKLEIRNRAKMKSLRCVKDHFPYMQIAAVISKSCEIDIVRPASGS